MDLALTYMGLLPSNPRAWSMLLRAVLDAGRKGNLEPLPAIQEVWARATMSVLLKLLSAWGGGSIKVIDGWKSKAVQQAESGRGVLEGAEESQELWGGQAGDDADGTRR